MRALGYTDGEVKRPLDAFFESVDNTKATEILVSEFLAYLSSH